MSRRCVYIAGPLSSPLCTGYLANVHRFVSVAVTLRRAGYAPYNPADDFVEGIMAGDFEYEDYFEPNLAWLEKADAVYLIDPSPGANRECDRARDLAIPVVRTLAELHAVFEDDWVGRLPSDPDQ